MMDDKSNGDHFHEGGDGVGIRLHRCVEHWDTQFTCQLIAFAPAKHLPISPFLESIPQGLFIDD